MFNKPALACIMLTSALTASAQTITEIPAKKGRSAYVEDSQGNIMRTPYGHCWRSALWTPADAVAGCDGELQPPVLKPTAPPLASGTAPAVSTNPVPAEPAKRCDFTVTLASARLFKPGSSALTGGGKKLVDDAVSSRLAGCRRIDGTQVTAYDKTAAKPEQLPARRAGAVAAHLKASVMATQTNLVSVADTKAAAACGRSLRGKQRAECRAMQRAIEIAVRGAGR